LKLYEGMFILNDARCGDDYAGTVNVVHEILTKQGAEIVDSRKWDERKLTYPIRRQQRGVYVIVHFNSPPEAISQIERQLRLSGDVVLRHLIVVDEDGVSLGAEKEIEQAAREARKIQQEAERSAAADENAQDAQPAESPETAPARPDETPDETPAAATGGIRIAEESPEAAEAPDSGGDVQEAPTENETEREETAQQQQDAQKAETTEEPESAF